MNIRQHILLAINDRMAAQRIVCDGVPGVLFAGPDEAPPDDFVPFEFLGYNSDLGYFDRRVFPDQPSDCTNENPETIHHVLQFADESGHEMYAWAQDETGIVTLLGHKWQLGDLYQALGAFLLRNELSEPLDEEEVGDNLHWLQASDAAYFASKANPARFPQPDDQLQNSIRVAGSAGRIRTRQGESGRTYYERPSVEEWALREETRGRPRKEKEEPIVKPTPKTWRDDPATEKQIARLRSYNIDPTGMTKGQASDEIDKRKKSGMVTCWECGCSVPRSQAEWDGMGWYCGC